MFFNHFYQAGYQALYIYALCTGEGGKPKNFHLSLCFFIFWLTELMFYGIVNLCPIGAM